MGWKSPAVCLTCAKDGSSPHLTDPCLLLPPAHSPPAQNKATVCVCPVKAPPRPVVKVVAVKPVVVPVKVRGGQRVLKKAGVCSFQLPEGSSV